MKRGVLRNYVGYPFCLPKSFLCWFFWRIYVDVMIVSIYGVSSLFFGQQKHLVDPILGEHICFGIVLNKYLSSNIPNIRKENSEWDFPSRHMEKR